MTREEAFEKEFGSEQGVRVGSRDADRFDVLHEGFDAAWAYVEASEAKYDAVVKAADAMAEDYREAARTLHEHDEHAQGFNRCCLEACELVHGLLSAYEAAKDDKL